MAEAVFRYKVESAGLGRHIETDSAGTGGWHIGQSPHAGTCRLLQSKGIDYRHRARQISLDDFGHFDYLVAMDSENVSDLVRMGQTSARVVLLLSYAPECGMLDVPDPWYTGDFDETYCLIDAATDGLLAEIRRHIRQLHPGMNSGAIIE